MILQRNQNSSLYLIDICSNCMKMLHVLQLFYILHVIFPMSRLLLIFGMLSTYANFNVKCNKNFKSQIYCKKLPILMQYVGTLESNFFDYCKVESTHQYKQTIFSHQVWKTRSTVLSIFSIYSKCAFCEARGNMLLDCRGQ